MALLTCENHRALLWGCKDMAITDNRYNGCRNIFFFGFRKSEESYEADEYLRDAEGKPVTTLHECACPPSKLILLKMDNE